MTVIQRRIFYGKVGTAGQLVEHLREGYERLKQFSGSDLEPRLLTDYMSGRSDRVVTEDEADSVGDIEAAYGRAMAHPEAISWFQPWERKLHELIHYAETESWTVR